MGNLLILNLPATVHHSLKVNPVHERVWYGRMFLPAADAIFAEGSECAHVKSIGCSGAHDVVGSVQHRRQLHEPNCTLPNEAACWMQCVAIIDCGSGEELRCMNEAQTTEWVLSSDGAGSCVDGVQCIVGVFDPAEGLKLVCRSPTSSPTTSPNGSPESICPFASGL